MPRLLAALAIAFGCFFATSSAQAQNYCGSGEGCAVGAYVVVTGGGLVTSSAIQVKLLRGEPIEDGWRISGGTLAGLNMLTGAGLLLASALVEDADDAAVLGILGSLNVAIATSNGFTLLMAETAGEDPPPGDVALPEGDAASAPLGASFSFRF